MRSWSVGSSARACARQAMRQAAGGWAIVSPAKKIGRGQTHRKTAPGPHNNEQSAGGSRIGRPPPALPNNVA